MKFDKVDKKIIRTLKKEKFANINRLILKSFARESQNVFRRRLNRLEDNNIIIINGGRNEKSTGNRYVIKLRDKNQKVYKS